MDDTGWNLEDALDELCAPDCFAHAPDHVELVVTHISAVLLAGDLVYKLKKPVQLPFFDATDIEVRRQTCEDEVRLNRRLCPDVYLGVVPLRRAAAGLRFGPGNGAIVDWAVCMRRMPATEMLDQRLAGDTVTPGDVRELAAIVARFHRDGDRSTATRRAGAPANLIANARANFVETETLIGTCFDPALHRALRERVDAELGPLETRLEQRASQGKIVEGHGDLHARNICMTDPPSIYDCVEFSHEFRCGDVATDVAFLAMDLRHRGHTELATEFIDAYVRESGDHELRSVLSPLVRYRAMVRAKVAGFASMDATVPESDRAGALGSARRHLRLAAASRIEDDAPLFLVACGLPGSGKSYAFEQLAKETGWTHLQSDVIRKQLAGVSPTTPAPETAYTSESSDRTYAVLLEQAAAGGPFVLLDANFPSRQRRRAALDAAQRAGARGLIVWFRVDATTARDRTRQRAARGGSVSDAGPDVFAELSRRFAPPAADEPFVAIDGTATKDAILDATLTSALRMPS